MRTYTVPNCSLGAEGGETLQKCTPAEPAPSMPQFERRATSALSGATTL